jgi:hypothetical protein
MPGNNTMLRTGTITKASLGNAGNASASAGRWLLSGKWMT